MVYSFDNPTINVIHNIAQPTKTEKKFRRTGSKKISIMSITGKANKLKACCLLANRKSLNASALKMRSKEYTIS